jgi:hypothetical protein
MIACLIGVSALLGSGLGWLGYRASLRIAEWGRNMDECDRIFQMAAGEMPEARDEIVTDGQRIASLGAAHGLSSGAAALK